MAYMLGYNLPKTKCHIGMTPCDSSGAAYTFEQWWRKNAAGDTCNVVELLVDLINYKYLCVNNHYW